jgi:hypothetical protein
MQVMSADLDQPSGCGCRRSIAVATPWYVAPADDEEQVAPPVTAAG